jgi:O-antigen ligase
LEYSERGHHGRFGDPRIRPAHALGAGPDSRPRGSKHLAIAAAPREPNDRERQHRYSPERVTEATHVAAWELHGLEKIEQRRILPPMGLAAPARERPFAQALPREAADGYQANGIAISAILALVILLIAATNQHAMDRYTANLATAIVRGIVPLGAAALAALCVWRPALALAGFVALTPAFNAAQLELVVGPFQVIGQTIVLVPLLVGCAYRRMAPPRSVPTRETSSGTPMPVAPEWWQTAPMAAAGAAARYVGTAPMAVAARRTGASAALARYRAHRFAEAGGVLFVAVAAVSTLASPDAAASANILLHGIVEPFLMGAVLVAARPSRREIALVAAGLGLSVALGSAMSVLQSFTQFHSIAGILANRMFFSWYAFGNVGSFGVLVAAILPLEFGLLAARRQLGLDSRLGPVLVAVTALSLAGLFFSLSKSAWISAFVAAGALAFVLAGSWKLRAAFAGVAAAASALFIPWPALALQSFPQLASAYRQSIVAVVGQSRFDSWNPATLTGHGSMAERYYAVEGGLRMALDHPFLGVGLGQFAFDYTPALYRPAQALDALTHAHSVFPQVAAELGLLAAILVAALVAAALWSLVRVSRAGERATSVLALSIGAGIVAWFLAATAYGCVIYVATDRHAPDVVVIAVLIGMAVALAKTLYEPESAGRPSA